MATQAQVLPACAALHNFIMKYDLGDVECLLVAQGGHISDDDNNDTRMLAQHHVTA